MRFRLFGVIGFRLLGGVGLGVSGLRMKGIGFRLFGCVGAREFRIKGVGFRVWGCRVGVWGLGGFGEFRGLALEEGSGIAA